MLVFDSGVLLIVDAATPCRFIIASIRVILITILLLIRLLITILSITITIITTRTGARLIRASNGGRQ